MTVSTIFVTPLSLPWKPFYNSNLALVFPILSAIFLQISHIMEQILGLLGSGGGGIGGLSEKIALNTSEVEKDYMAGKQKEAELELGLGLSLGAGGGGGGRVKGKGSAAAWGEYGRILTAKDFPNGFCSGTKRERAAADSDVEAGTASTGVSQVVGWPPIRAYRMNTLVNQAKNSSAEEGKGVGVNEKNENSKKKINHGSNKNDTCNNRERIHPWLVKVNMNGLQIGRKLDLNAHMSYEMLAKTLEDMFFNPSLNIHGGKEQSMLPPKLLDATSEFVLTYEDKEGDWMLVGDVPWGMFVNTVKRLKIMRTSEASGLAPKFQERNEKQKGRPI